ncbi:MAG: glycoside hydrolase family 11 protein [Oscillospiraceae bacterium]|nr:glycoside hydrolase family 11 protein [Oscillospiraceae bacterium]
MAILILTLLIVPVPTAAAENSLIADFEDGTVMGFDVRGTAAEKEAGTGVLTVVTEEAHGGQYSLLISERRQNWNGPAFNVAPYITPGTYYDISVWVLPKTPDRSAFILSTQIGEGRGVEYINLMSKTVSKADGWTELTGQYAYGDEDFITVYVENETTGAEFYIDDFSFAVSGAGEWDPAVDPLTNNNKGVFDGFNYELWKNDRSDEASMLLTGGGTFKCEWENNAFALFRTGKKLGSEKSYEEYGEVILKYGAEHTIGGDVSYLCMYGWTEDPMIEFYIVENHGSYKPPGGKGFQGTYAMDGSVYEVYVDTRVEQPSIQGTKTFEQYFAVRTDMRTAGTITVSDHFKEWDKLGLDMSGKMYEVSLCVEGYRGNGSANVYEHVLTIGGDVYGAPAAEPETEDIVEPPAEPEPPEVVDTPPEPEVPAEPEPGSGNLIFIILAAAAVLVIGMGIFLWLKRK